MALEIATRIQDLVATNPVGATDFVSQGDDHLRTIKAAVQGSLPNLGSGQVTASAEELSIMDGATLSTAELNILDGVTLTAAQINDAARLGAVNAFTAANSFSVSVTFGAPILAAAGSAAAPAYSFTAAANAGLYNNAGNGELRMAYGGTDVAAWNASYLSAFVPLYHSDGSAAAPSVTFRSDPNTGMYRVSSDNLGFAVAGAIGLQIDQLGRLFPTSNIYAANGAVATPAYAFLNDADTGLYSLSANAIGIAAGGALSGFLTTTGMYTVNGTVSNPSFSFINDSDSGIYSNGADDMRFAVGGALYAAMLAAGTPRVSMQKVTALQDGTAATPGLMFENDQNTGLYSIGADALGFAEGGAGYRIGYRNIPQNSQSANYTAVLADSGKHLLHPSGGGAGDTFTIPANGSVAYELGTAITFVNRDSNSLSIAITTDTLILAGTTSTGTRTLAQNGVATAIKVESTTWVISGSGLS